MTVLQRWIIAVRGRGDCGNILGGQRFVGVCGDGDGDRRSPSSKEPNTCEL
jgi:hypothetical protein